MNKWTVLIVGVLVFLGIVHYLENVEIQDLGYFTNSNGHLFPYIKGDWNSYKGSLQRAIWDLNETGGIVYCDMSDNSTYYINGTFEME